MSYIYQNLNPKNKLVDDCVIRAIALVTGKTWNDIYWELSVEAFIAKDKLDRNEVWGGYLLRNGFRRYILPDTCPICYTVRDFARDHREGVFVLGDGNHVVPVVEGHYIDTSDSGDMTVLVCYAKEI